MYVYNMKLSHGVVNNRIAKLYVDLAIIDQSIIYLLS